MIDKKIKIRTRKPYIAYPGSMLQHSYAEDLKHGYLFWDIKDHDQFNVDFCSLPNFRPFVTISWEGSISGVIEIAKSYPQGSRFRIRTADHMSQGDIVSLTNALRTNLGAAEVTYKFDKSVDTSVISSGTVTVMKEDLRNHEVLLRFLHEYNTDANVSDQEWDQISDLVESYLKDCCDGDEVVRNTKWSLKHASFDNMFSFGEGNTINFEKLQGITGIFGPNRVGKSSIVGMLMYALFNSSDRGSLKNLHVVNVRKQHCRARLLIDVNGIDYVIERQTTKHGNKRGDVNAVTHLNLYQLKDGGLIDLNGEQRNDTEKTIRRLIGTPEDCLLTSMSVQGDINRFISQGSTQRKMQVAKYLDLDIFDMMYESAKNDVNSLKGALKNYPDKDWIFLIKQQEHRFLDVNKEFDRTQLTLDESIASLDALKGKLLTNVKSAPITRSQLDTLRNKVKNAETQHIALIDRINRLTNDLTSLRTTIAETDDARSLYDVDALKKQLSSWQKLQSTIRDLKHIYERESTLFKQQEHALRILDEVPCGDEYPSCKFIKDAHVIKPKLQEQQEKVKKASSKLSDAQLSLVDVSIDDIQKKLDEYERLIKLGSDLQNERSTKTVELAVAGAKIEQSSSALDVDKCRLVSLEHAMQNDESHEVVMLRREIDVLTTTVSKLDAEKLRLATLKGKLQSEIDQLKESKSTVDSLLSKLKIHEIVANAFSKHGIPNHIINSQLPLINAEIAKILYGIVDFTIELETDVDNNSLDIFINYDDSRRMIELASGMEKMISSLAIRVALTNISSLPKMNTLVIDEGFGVLDDSSVEACNRLLIALKRNFHNVLIISHVDGIKDSADNIIEVFKKEKDAAVMFE